MTSQDSYDDYEARASAARDAWIDMGVPADEAQNWYEADMYAENLPDLWQAWWEAGMEAQLEAEDEPEPELPF